MRILLLGGTAEAAALARKLADTGVDAVYSYAGRVAKPRPQPLPMRIGGFGGAEGLADYLQAHRITHVVDATHPFAAQISRNAVAACARTNTCLIALQRPPWGKTTGDQWVEVPDYTAAIAALPPQRAVVFLAIGKQDLAAFAGLPHRWLLRFAAPDPAAQILPDASLIVQRGPFSVAQDTRMMRQYGVEILIAKNAGGDGAYAKLAAARTLGLPVIMIARPDLPAREVVATPAKVMARLFSG